VFKDLKENVELLDDGEGITKLSQIITDQLL